MYHDLSGAKQGCVRVRFVGKGLREALPLNKLNFSGKVDGLLSTAHLTELAVWQQLSCTKSPRKGLYGADLLVHDKGRIIYSNPTRKSAFKYLCIGGDSYF